MVTVPNQKIVGVRKEKPGHDNKIYATYDWQLLSLAIRNLNYTSVIVYLYIFKNKNEFVFALSPRDIMDATGLSITSVHRAIKELIGAGYLTQGPKPNYYIATEKSTKPLQDNNPDSALTAEELFKKSFFTD
jgi:DNA-binding MarR family transcriptional regulator